MRSVVTFLNKKNGSGKTTLGLNLAAILAGETGQKTAFLELNDSIYETALLLSPGKTHYLNGPRDKSGYFLEKAGFYLFWSDSPRKAIEYFHDSLDMLVIDTESMAENLVYEISDRIIVPTTLNPVDIKYAKFTIDRLLGMKYPAGLVNVIVNRADTGLLSCGDIQQVFGNVKVLGVLPYKKEVEEATARGEIYYCRNRKDPFISALQKAVAFINPEFPKPYLEILEKHGAARPPAETECQGADNSPARGEKAGHAEDDNKKIKIMAHKALFDEIDVKNLEKDAMTHPEKKIKIFEEIKKKIREILDKARSGATDREKREALVLEIFDEVTGLGAIEGLLRDPEISEIMVNRHDEIYIEKKGKLYLSDKKFTDDNNVLRAIERIVFPLGRRIDESMPYVDARLQDGSRVNAIIPPLAIDGPVLTIRKFSKKKLVSDDLVKFGSLTLEAVEYLKSAVLKRKNILISGGTGSGKTTLLNVLSSFIPEDERIITVEDSAELKLTQDHVVRLEARPPNIEGKGAVTIRDLVKNCLRMRPDRIVVGECRGGETLDMLQAMNTGHEGSMTTVHANTPRDALNRIDVMVLMAGVDLPLRAIREQVKSAINIVVQQARLKDGSRKVTFISEITGMEGDTILMHDVFKYMQSGENTEGKILGELRRADRIYT